MTSNIVRNAFVYVLGTTLFYSSDSIAAISLSELSKERGVPQRIPKKEEIPKDSRFFPFVAPRREDYIVLEKQYDSLVHSSDFYSPSKGQHSESFYGSGRKGKRNDRKGIGAAGAYMKNQRRR